MMIFVAFVFVACAPIAEQTITLQNLPRRFSGDDLIGVLTEKGFEVGKDFNYVYIPCDFRDRRNVCNHGIGFVNFQIPHHLQSNFDTYLKELLFDYLPDILIKKAERNGFYENACFCTREKVKRIRNYRFAPAFFDNNGRLISRESLCKIVLDMVQNTEEGNSIVEVEDCNARKGKRRSHPKAKMKSLRSFSREDDSFRESKHSPVFDMIERNVED